MADSSESFDVDEGIAKQIYQSVDEYPTPVDAEITGRVPGWIEGALLRVGPGKLEWGDTHYKHLFDGDAILNRFEIKDGNVKFSSRFLRSSSYVESEKRGCIALSQFGTVAPPDPCKNIFSRFFSYFAIPNMTDNCNVNVVKIKDDYYASTETTKMWKIDKDTLESLERTDVHESLKGPRSWLAHPHYDDNDAYYNCSSAFVKRVHELIKIPSRKSKDESSMEGMEVVARIPYQGAPGYYHSFSMTENFFLIYESSVFLSNPLKMLMMKIMNWSYVDMMKFDPNIQSKLHLIDRKSGKIAATFKVDAFMCFHQINAYETSNEVIFDMCGYSDAVILQAAYLDALRSGKNSTNLEAPLLRRYHLPLENVNTDNPVTLTLPKYDDGKDYEVIFDGIELPRINYNHYNGKDYSFAYGMGTVKSFGGLTTLIKVNVKTKESKIWKENNCSPSEPVFIPNPDSASEDQGVVLSSVLGLNGKKSFLLLLDGETFEEVARAYVPYKLVPLIHGDFAK